MAIELRMLVWSTIVLMAVILIQAFSVIRTVGPGPLAGNRESLPPPTEFQARGKRAVGNHIENLVIFAPLVLVAVVSKHLDTLTALGAQLFFWGRLAHAAIYFAGVPYVRTIAFGVSLAGTILVLRADLL
jgi:uncharacterized MAPEG superfamily protein